jgi:hypothetical protein
MALHGLTWESCYLRVPVSTEMKPGFTTKQNELGSISAVSIPCRYEFTKFILASWYASQSLWNTVVLYVCKCSSLVAVCGDDRNMIICCSSWATDFLGDVSNVAPILFSLPLVHVFCRFSAWYLLTHLQIVLVETVSPGNFYLNLHNTSSEKCT